ncbi:MAG: PrgI family protein [Candidatus Blackburnbacteria bacterium]|nr:PrgI family protein [Candidatus Blackburnbacteria bacterium]
MQQHPVPQEITSYEFRLVGDMTLKQFLQLASGAGIAFLFFVSPIPGFVKWPLVVFAALFGIALAFLPVDERPLSHWIFSFFKAIYSPTLYVWMQGGSEGVFQEEGVLPVIITPQGEEKAKKYLNEVPQPQVMAGFEEEERTFFQKVHDAFATEAPQISTSSVFARPNDSLQAPLSTPVKVEHTQKTFEPVRVVKPVYAPVGVSPVFAQPVVSTNVSQQAVFSVEAAPPNPPTQLNTVVGQVLALDGKMVEGAILEIREVGGLPKRALRTNKVGHFLSVTPLENGEYEIETEKEGFGFDVVSFKAEGNIIPPILIRAKALVN